MELNEIASTREIILVCGNIACGKGTYCQTKYAGYAHITVSDIVKRLSNQTERSELGKTAHLDNAIVEALIQQIDQYNKVVVDGIRQVSILYELEQYYESEIKKIVWLDVPRDVCEQRFASRQDKKDNLDYDAATKSDEQLGINSVERYIRAQHEVEPL